MRLFTISDLHIDFQENRHWLFNLSRQDYQEDLLIVAGDLTPDVDELRNAMAFLKKCFKFVFFVPGNHDLSIKDGRGFNSLEKFYLLQLVLQEEGISLEPLCINKINIVPLYSWYDFSFGLPGPLLRRAWNDFKQCEWPASLPFASIEQFFARQNQSIPFTDFPLISFSHFLPRLDLLPWLSRQRKGYLLPVLGSTLLEKQIRSLKPLLHIYGHSHLNRDVVLEKIRYINNAFGYPHEKTIAAKKLKEITLPLPLPHPETLAIPAPLPGVVSPPISTD